MKSAARLLALAALTALAPAALAGDNYYTNAAGNSDWLTAANWSLGHVPNTTDDVYIPAGKSVVLRGGQGHYASNINVFGSLYSFQNNQPTVLNCKQIITYGGGIWNTTGLLISHSNIFNVGYMYFNGCSIWDSNYVDANIVHITNYAGATIDLLGSNVVGQIDNQGYLSLFGTVSLGASLTGTPGGSIFNNTGGNVYLNNGALVVSGNANQQVFQNTSGTIIAQGGGWCQVASSIWFRNAADCIAVNTSVFLDNCYSQNFAGVLFEGRWTTQGGAYNFNGSRPVSRVDYPVTVDLKGGSMDFSTLTSISGIVRASNGSAVHAIPSGGVLSVDGTVEVDSNSYLLVSGAMETTNANFIMHVDGSSSYYGNYGYVVVTNWILGHGTTWLNVYNDNGYIPQPGDNYALITAYGGQGFDNLNPYRWSFPNDSQLAWSLNGPTFSLYYKCAADIDANGFVNGDDYDLFASYFESGSIFADLNGDTFVNGDDYDMFASAFEAGC
ncbi:MAG: hypothetical protein U0638_15750 [Phycisphaerales bacterium]